MALYTLINIAVLAAPFLLSFDRRVAFFRSWPALIIAIVPVSGVYLVWDALVTKAGHWWFSPEYAGAVSIAGLPIGEILFFVTVPYSCLFIYGVVNAYFRERTLNHTSRVRIIAIAVAIGFLILAGVLDGTGYTALASLSVGVMLFVSAVFDPAMWMSSHTLLFFILSYIPFIIVNGVLTALPIVNYNPEAILGPRVYTIPVEDFLYNFGMLGFHLFFFRLARRLIRRPGNEAGMSG